jgi:hypothetical protein
MPRKSVGFRQYIISNQILRDISGNKGSKIMGVLYLSPNIKHGHTK